MNKEKFEKELENIINKYIHETLLSRKDMVEILRKEAKMVEECREDNH